MESTMAQFLDAAKAAASSRSRDHLERASSLLIEIKSRSDASLSNFLSSAATEEEARLRLAEADDELRTLKYERARLRRSLDEMTSELSVPDIASIISVDEARRVRARSSESTQSSHQEMLLRLGVERDERARLCADRDALLAQRQSLAAAAASAAERKAAVDVQLENVASAAASLQEPIDHVGDGKKSEAAAALAANPLLKELPTPLHTLAIGISANVLASTAGVSLEIVEAAPSAASAATKAAGKGKAAAPPAASTGGAVFDAHPLHLCLHLKHGKAKAAVTFRYHPKLEILTAAAEPPAVEQALRSLVPALDGVEDDGNTYPDFSSLLRGRSEQPSGEAPPSLPFRAYRWLQWCGGLGPLLTSPPRPTQPIMTALVAAVSRAIQKGK